MAQYEFSYMVVKNGARIDGDQLTVKMGLRKKQLAIPSLKYLYVKKNDSASMEELLLSYESKPGKLSLVRVAANEDEPGFQSLVEDLVARRPDIDLRSRPAAEAHKLMGAMDTEKLAFVIAPALVIAVVGIFVAPFLIHGLDSGQADVTVAELTGGNLPKTRNVTVRGLLDVRKSVIKTTTRKGTETKRLYIPMRAPGSDGSEPVHVILKTDDMTTAELRRLMSRDSYPGVLRNVWWEGLDGDVADHLTEKLQVRLADPVRVIEYEASAAQDLMIALVILGITAAIMGILGIVMWVIRFRGKS